MNTYFNPRKNFNSMTKLYFGLISIHKYEYDFRLKNIFKLDFSIYF